MNTTEKPLSEQLREFQERYAKTNVSGSCPYCRPRCPGCGRPMPWGAYPYWERPYPYWEPIWYETNTTTSDTMPFTYTGAR